jgi:hypothetical protein
MATIISTREIFELRNEAAFASARSRIGSAVGILLEESSPAKRCFLEGKGNNHPEVTVEATKEALACLHMGEDDFHVFGNTMRKFLKLIRGI